MTSTPLNPSSYAAITFDCYGTLIDMENGLLGYLQPLLQSYYINTIDSFVLRQFIDSERIALAAGGNYRTALAHVVQSYANRLAFTATDETLQGLAQSIQYWQPFIDTHDALVSLQQDFKLGIVTNMDDELVTTSAKLLNVEFDALITAQQVGAYKPSLAPFNAALAALPGPILHVCQYGSSDTLAATDLGIDTAWIERPTHIARTTPDTKPTWTFDSMQAFTAAIIS